MTVGVRDLLPFIPPILIASWGITSPTQALTIARIADSTDPTYGTIGWLPPTDGTPWALVRCTGTKETVQETARVRAIARVEVFLALDEADTPAVYVDFHDRALAWADAFRQLVASNRRLGTSGSALLPTAGDIVWDFLGSDEQEARALYGGHWRGVSLSTSLAVSILVSYQG